MSGECATDISQVAAKFRALKLVLSGAPNEDFEGGNCALFTATLLTVQQATLLSHDRLNPTTFLKIDFGKTPMNLQQSSASLKSGFE